MPDFFSDTKTRPTRAMREAVLAAEVGDEQKGEDPTTEALCVRVADLLGKEAAVFLPSGTMCNEIAIRVHVRPGDELICSRSSHIVGFEGGGPAAISGAMIQALDGTRGMFTADQVQAAIRPDSRYAPRSRLLCVEQTANLAGGAIWPLDELNDVAATAQANGLSTHMDGARLMNAAIASGIPASSWAEAFDSVWIDFTKGLGAPVGAVLAGSEAFIDEAWRLKQQFGGAMRQSGILASMCIYALDHHVERLAKDHSLAQLIFAELSEIETVINILPVDTNIVIFDLREDAPSAPQLVDLCASDQIQIGAFGERRIRVVTHLDVDGHAADKLIQSLRVHLRA